MPDSDHTFLKTRNGRKVNEFESIIYLILGKNRLKGLMKYNAKKKTMHPQKNYINSFDSFIRGKAKYSKKNAKTNTAIELRV